MITKRITIIESFVIVSSFGCDLEIENRKNKKKKFFLKEKKHRFFFEKKHRKGEKNEKIQKPLKENAKKRNINTHTHTHTQTNKKLLEIK